MKSLFSLATTVVATLCVSIFSAQIAEAQPSKGVRDMARESVIDTLVASNRFVTFPRLTIFYQKQDDGSYSGTFKGEDYEHPEGVFGSRRVEFLDYPANPVFKGFSLYSDNVYRVWPDGTTFLSRETCLEKANELKAMTWPNPNFESGQALEPVVKEDRYSVSVRWDYYEVTKMLRRSITIRIRKIDGKCSYINGSQLKWTNNEDERKSALSYKAAVVAAGKLLNTRPAYKTARLSSWKIENRNGEYYVLQYEFPVKDGATKNFQVFVNTDTGKSFFGVPKETEYRQINDYHDQRLRDEHHYDDDHGIPYQTPFWTRQGLIFGSSSFRQSFDTKSIGPKLMLRDSDGKFSVFYALSDWRYNIRFAAPWSDWVVIDDGNGTYAINVADGSTRKLDSNNDNVTVVNISQLGMKTEATELVIGDKNDVRIIEQLPRASTTDTGKVSSRPVTMKVLNDLSTCFSPDGKSVYIYRSTARAGETRKGVSIRKMDTRKFLESTSKVNRDLIKESVPFFYMPNGLERMEFYPDGQQIFVVTGDYEAPVVIFDLKTRKLTPITTDDIYQKNAGILSDVDEIYRGEKSGELIIKASKNKDEPKFDPEHFEESMMDSAPEYFFSCRLNGSNLKQIVPDGQTNTMYYQFPSGKTGYDVTKEIGLQQVVW